MFVVTGGGSGIGRALAHALAKRDQSVLIVGRHEELLAETATCSPLIRHVSADVSTEAGLALIKEHLDDIPIVNGLINNAGTLSPIAPVHQIQPKEWSQIFRTNVDPALFLSQLLMSKLTDGRVLNIGSGAAYFPIQGWTAYCVSKAALAMLTRCWQLESSSVAFASVMPGIVNTAMQSVARHASHMAPEQVKFYQRLKKDNRLIAPETVAEFLTWLLLDVDKTVYHSKEWDIYDTSHHFLWLKKPHEVLHWDY